MDKPMREKKSSLLRSVEERALAKKTQEEKRKQEVTDHIPYLPKDCASRILIWLPLDALHRSMFVCKPWYNIINDEKFIDEHIRRSETVLLFISPTKRVRHSFEMVSIFPEKPNSFSVEAQLNKCSSAIVFQKSLVNSALKFNIKFLEIKDGKSRVGEYNISCLGRIRATCNGLILLDNKVNRGGLVIMNPVTRKLMSLPLGTLSSEPDESYGFALSDAIVGYKVVHLFRDYLGYANCEVLNVGARSWRAIDGPSFGAIRWFGHSPVSALGALHWIPQFDRSDHIVSMEVNSEKFHQVALPKSGRIYDGIVELNGCLAFVTHEGADQIDVWILKALVGEVWTKQHSIATGCKFDMVPISSLRIGGEMVFKRGKNGSLYLYNFRLGELKKVEMGKECVPFSVTYLPHVNSLVSWCRNNGIQDM